MQLLYLLVTPLPLWYYSNSWWLHAYHRAARVAHGGCNVTLVIMQYLPMVPQVYWYHYNIFCWLYWNHSVTTVSPGCDTCSKRHFWWRHWYLSTTTVSSEDSTGRLIAPQYILVALLEPLCHYVIFCWRHWFLASLQYHLMAPLVPLCHYSISLCHYIISDGSTVTVVPRQYLLVAPLQP